MKYLLLTGLILLALGSCKKDSNNSDDSQEPTTRNYYINYKVNGSQIAHEGEWQPNNGSGVQSRREPLGIGTGNEKN